jgi:hypothetical protein
MSAKTATAAPMCSPSINGFAVSVPTWIPWTSAATNTPIDPKWMALQTRCPIQFCT